MSSGPSARKPSALTAKVDAVTETALEASIVADPDDVHQALDWGRAVGSAVVG
jgi:hypothetical protein